MFFVYLNLINTYYRLLEINNMNLIEKLLTAVGEDKKLNEDKWTKEHTYYSLNCYMHQKKWVANILPSELLTRSVKEAVESIVTLCESDILYETFPDFVESPKYGDNWGRLANYIELNNRAIARMNMGRTCCGILSCIKLLPAIPPSAKSWANCIVLSQIFPNIFGDTYNKGSDEENSIYGIKLNAGYSYNIISSELADKVTPDEQIEIFNILAHFRGIKTGFRTVISEDQMKVCYPDKEENFRWSNPEHVEIYIKDSVKLMNLGFEAMFIDSAKHIGGYDMGNYTGVGALPGYEQMQYVLHEIRRRSGKTALSFIGEKSTDDFVRYEKLGLNAGTDFITGDNFYAVRELSEQLKYNRIYAPGVEVENDNYGGGLSYEQRLNRISSALFGFYCASDKLPSFMQTNDIFPLRYDTNTHHIMMSNPSYSNDGSPESHWENLFAKDDGRFYNHKVAELFAHALCL